MPKDNLNRKIVLTGGHAATTAIATIEELMRRTNNEASWDIYWVGAKRAMEGKKIQTLEATYLPKMGVTFKPIVAGRLQRKFTLWTVPSLLKIPFGFVHAFIILCKIRPDNILSFGGFAALPVVVVGRLMGIYSILHEQTIAFGRANRASSFFVNKIALARKESLEFFPKNKCVVVGNPVMTKIAELKEKEKLGSPPTIFILGGSRGSQALNNTISEIVPSLLKKYNVIHATGELDYKKCLAVKSKLDRSVREKYQLYSTIDPMQIANMYKVADLVISSA